MMTSTVKKFIDATSELPADLATRCRELQELDQQVDQLTRRVEKSHAAILRAAASATAAGGSSSPSSPSPPSRRGAGAASGGGGGPSAGGGGGDGGSGGQRKRAKAGGGKAAALEEQLKQDMDRVQALVKDKVNCAADMYDAIDKLIKKADTSKSNLEAQIQRDRDRLGLQPGQTATEVLSVMAGSPAAGGSTLTAAGGSTLTSAGGGIGTIGIGRGGGSSVSGHHRHHQGRDGRGRTGPRAHAHGSGPGSRREKRGGRGRQSMAAVVVAGSPAATSPSPMLAMGVVDKSPGAPVARGVAGGGDPMGPAAPGGGGGGSGGGGGGGAGRGGPAGVELGHVDLAEPRYCFCNNVSHGEMIACDNPECAIEWFHFDCVGITKESRPKGKWYCPQCASTMKKGGRPKSVQQ